MNLRRRVAVVLVAVLCQPAWVGAQTVCRPADPAANTLRLDIGRYSSATSGDDKIVRDTLRLPLVPVDQITVVVQESVCKKANAAFQTYWANRGGTAFSGQIYVLKVGSLYAVQDPVYRYRTGSLYTPTLFLDSRYRAVSVL